MVEMPNFHWGTGFDCWSGNEGPACCTVRQKKKAIRWILVACPPLPLTDI